MHQKVTYLSTLYDTITKEQSNLLTYLQKRKDVTKNSKQLFLDDITEAEIEMRTAYGHLNDSKNFAKAEQHYNHGMKLFQNYTNYTTLLNHLVLELQSQRARARLENGNVQGCLEDTTSMLSVNIEERELKMKVLKLHARVLVKLDRLDDAKEAISKLRLISPEDEDIQLLMERINIT